MVYLLRVFLGKKPLHNTCFNDLYYYSYFIAKAKHNFVAKSFPFTPHSEIKKILVVPATELRNLMDILSFLARMHVL